MESNAWLELLKQLAFITPLVLASTQWLNFGVTGTRRRLLAILYSMFWTFSAYLVGAIYVPAIIPAEFQGQLWARFFVLFAAAAANAIVSMLAKDGIQATASLATKRSDP